MDFNLKTCDRLEEETRRYFATATAAAESTPHATPAPPPSAAGPAPLNSTNAAKAPLAAIIVPPKVIAAFEARRWLHLATAILVVSIVHVNAVGIMSNGLQKLFKLSQTTVTFVNACGSIVNFLAFPAGWLQDRRGPHLAVAIATIATIIGFTLFAEMFNGSITTHPLALVCLAMLLSTSFSGYCDASGMLTSLYHFSANRGDVVVLQKTFMGLSGTIMSLTYLAFFKAQSGGSGNGGAGNNSTHLHQQQNNNVGQFGNGYSDSEENDTTLAHGMIGYCWACVALSAGWALCCAFGFVEPPQMLSSRKRRFGKSFFVAAESPLANQDDDAALLLAQSDSGRESGSNAERVLDAYFPHEGSHPAKDFSVEVSRIFLATGAVQDRAVLENTVRNAIAPGTTVSHAGMSPASTPRLAAAALTPSSTSTLPVITADLKLVTARTDLWTALINTQPPDARVMFIAYCFLAWNVAFLLTTSIAGNYTDYAPHVAKAIAYTGHAGMWLFFTLPLLQYFVFGAPNTGDGRCCDWVNAVGPVMEAFRRYKRGDFLSAETSTSVVVAVLRLRSSQEDQVAPGLVVGSGDVVLHAAPAGGADGADELDDDTASQQAGPPELYPVPQRAHEVRAPSGRVGEPLFSPDGLNRSLIAAGRPTAVYGAVDNSDGGAFMSASTRSHELNFPRPYLEPFSATIRTPDLWLFWLTMIGILSTGATVQQNCEQIYHALGGPDAPAQGGTLAVSMVGVGSALGRVFIGVMDKMVLFPRRITATILLPLPPLLAGAGSLLLFAMPTSAMWLPIAMVSTAYGANWATLLLAVRQVYAVDLSQHYLFLYSAGLASVGVGVGIFGPWYDRTSRDQHADPGKCYGASCVTLPVLVMAGMCAFSAVMAVVFHLRWVRRNGLTRVGALKSAHVKLGH